MTATSRPAPAGRPAAARRNTVGRATAAARCLTATVRVAAGASVTLRLTCAVPGRTGKPVRLGGRRALAARPASGRLSRFDARRGTVRYTPRRGFAGRDTLRFTLRRANGRRYQGRIVLIVAAPRLPVPTASPTPAPVPAPAPDPSPTPTGEGLPAVPGSIAFAVRNWQPAAQDTCPRSLHERFSVVGPDGKLYPTWHPPTAVDPATGRECTFGHEHGRDPRGSDLFQWVTAHFAATPFEAHAGIPFGAATEALEAYAGVNADVTRRQEDHVGYKVEYENDVPLTTADGALGVTCDYLVRVHQGSHSPDALSNNVHELLYASRCSDGTEIISNIVSRFGAPGAYTRGCDTAVTVTTSAAAYPSGPGRRLIPDRACMESGFLVPAGRTTSVWAAYELWTAQNELRTTDRVLASYETGFGVFNPSRYGNPGPAIGRTLDLCRETEPSGDRANGPACDDALAQGTVAFDDPRSPFDGTHRDTYLRDTTLTNAGGPRLWWTDPYGDNASPQPFPGAICQLVATVDTPTRARVQQQVFGRNRTHDAPGVHAPN